VHSQFFCSRVANLGFLKLDFEIVAFFEHLAFFGNKKVRKIWLFLAYFQSDRLDSDITLSELHIHYKNLVKRVYYHAGCTGYCKFFSVALKMIYVIDKKQMHDSVITAKRLDLCYNDFFHELSIFCVIVHVLCVYASKLLSGFFGRKSGFFR